MASSLGRPRDKGGKSAPGKEIEMSNSTLSHFFGGKQPAWMTGSCSTDNLPNMPCRLSKASSQDNDSRNSLQHNIKAPISHQVIPSKAGMIPQMYPAKRPRTDQTSPIRERFETQAAMVPKDHSRRIDPMLPSPAPSEEIAHENDNGNAFEDGKESPPLQQSRGSELAETVGRRDGVAEAAIAPSVERQIDAREIPPSSAAEIFPFYHRERLPESEELPSPKRRMTSDVEYSMDRQPSSERVGRCRTVTNITMPRNNSQPLDPPLTSYLAAIDSRLEHAGNGGTLEERRLQLLREACESGDSFYLAIHQLFCMSSTTLSISSLPGLTNQHFQGMNVLKQILLPNDALSMSAIQWFSNFPSPLETLLQTSFRFQMAYECARECIAVLHLNWQGYQRHCFARLIPPLVDEMERDLCVKSPVMQRVIYLAIHRGFWIGEEDSCSHLSLQTFNASQDTTRAWRSRLGTANPPTAEEMSRYREGLIDKFQRLRNHHAQHLQQGTQANGQRTPTHKPQMAFPRERSHGSQTPQAIGIGLQTPWVPNPDATTFSPTMILPSQHFSSALPLNTVVSEHQHPHMERSGNTSMTTNMPLLQRNESIRNSSYMDPQMGQIHQATGFVERPQAYFNPPNTALTDQELYPSSIARPTPRTHSFPIPSSGTPLPMNNMQPTNQSTRRPPSSNLFCGTNISRSTNTLETSPAGMPATQASFRQGNPPTLTQPRWVSSRTAAPQAETPAHSPRAPVNLSQPLTLGFSTLYKTSSTDPLVVSSGAVGSSEVDNIHYQYVKDFAIKPFTMKPETRNTLKNFDISPQTWAVVPKHVRQTDGQLVRKIVPGSLQYRLRCVKVASVEGIPESSWVVEETTWPDFNIVVVLNGKALDIGRKTKDGKSPPVDITPVLQEGPNTLHLSIMRSGPAVDTVDFYAVAIEIVEVNNRENVEEAVGTLSLMEMKQYLLRQLGNNDPDIEVVNGNIAIGLTDPFSSCLINKPVRGKACKHYECFDLSTFLHTREGPVCRPEQFRCPICGADARPQTLMVDQWTLSVLTQVRVMRRFDAKAIIVDDKADWVIKESESDGSIPDRQHGTSQGAGALHAGRGTAVQEHDIIELD